MIENIIKSIKLYFETERLNGVSEYLFSEEKKDHGKDDGIEQLKSYAAECQRCALSKSRHNVVFGEGNIKAKLMFVGEAPGYDEDIQGRPFVGKAGMLLTKIIQAMGLKREDVYICNILKCRPNNNRDPLPDEINLCIEYLNKQIDNIHPKIICGLGKFASHVLLNTETPISRLRGTWHELKGIKFMPTYHPAYLLRNPKDKKLVWEDMQKIMAEL